MAHNSAEMTEIMQMLEMRVACCTLCHEGNVMRNNTSKKLRAA